MTLTELLAPVSDDMRVVDQVIRDRLRSDVPLINAIAEYIIAAGGKRLRPALLLMMSGALGYRGRFHHELAAVVEFIHTSTLLHDDVVDESDLRRGRKTANAVFGNAASVLVGDFLYSRAFQMMVEPGVMRVMSVLADATNTIAEGEVLQLINCHDPDVSQENYFQVIRFKTARLFEASAQLAAILAGVPAEVEAACAAYGRHLGTAFQLVDDVLDYSGSVSETGKNVGDDLREGKPTMPLIYLRDHGSEAEKAMVRAAISSETEPAIEPIIDALKGSGALDYTRECARREGELAAQAISGFADSRFKQTLIDLCAFSATRSQ